MSESGGRAFAKWAEAEEDPPRGRGPVALELIAVRGKDVIGVRHLIDGGEAWVGAVPAALARVPARDLGGHPHRVGEVRGGTHAISIPPRARARFHGVDGVPRLLVGPHRFSLRRGERAVLVFGGIQIRAQIVPYVPAAGAPGKVARALAGWLALVAVVYAGALAFAHLSAEAPPPVLERGALARAHARFLHQ